MSVLTSESRINASQQAQLHLKIWESSLSLRITLQKALETANKLPLINCTAIESDSVYPSIDISHLESAIESIFAMLQPQQGPVSSAESKRKRKRGENIVWEDISSQHKTNRLKWENVLNKWNSRLHFGSKDSQSKMKTFKQTYWEQIDVLVSDEKRVIEKSRIPLSDSSRLDKLEANNSTDANQILSNRYDLESYDDRQFYSLLLKSFIGQQQSSGLLSSNKDDLEALKKLRKNKNNVERKASKGRKLRYTTHTKLQNFMFPIELPVSDMDSAKLFQSLLQ